MADTTTVTKGPEGGDPEKHVKGQRTNGEGQVEAVGQGGYHIPVLDDTMAARGCVLPQCCVTAADSVTSRRAPQRARAIQLTAGRLVEVHVDALQL
eukprot:356874-Chlamydomonas_euryale.AAC.7